MDSTDVNTIVTIISTIIAIVLALWGTFNFVLPKKWRKNYLFEHNPSPNFDDEMKYHKVGGIYVHSKRWCPCAPERLFL